MAAVASAAESKCKAIKEIKGAKRKIREESQRGKWNKTEKGNDKIEIWGEALQKEEQT